MQTKGPNKHVASDFTIDIGEVMRYEVVGHVRMCWSEVAEGFAAFNVAPVISLSGYFSNWIVFNIVFQYLLWVDSALFWACKLIS